VFGQLFIVTVSLLLRNLCLHFARQDGQVGKNWKENHATKNQRRKYGMNETKMYFGECVVKQSLFI
jgi:hypothetical protein